MKLNERLRQLRAVKQMTQAEVAEQLHLTRQTISGYESGRTEPDLKTLNRLAEVYGVTLEELLRSEEAEGTAVRKSIWLLRMIGGLILLCILAWGTLLWVANRFYAVPPGQVSAEMAAVLEKRFAVTAAARWFEYALLLSGWWLGAVLLAQSVQRAVPVKRTWKAFGILAAGMLLATILWKGLFGFWPYAVISVLCRAALFLLVGLLIRKLFRR